MNRQLEQEEVQFICQWFSSVYFGLFGHIKLYKKNYGFLTIQDCKPVMIFTQLWLFQTLQTVSNLASLFLSMSPIENLLDNTLPGEYRI